MSEQQRITPAQRGSGRGPGIFDDDVFGGGDGIATVAHGPYAERLPVADFTVGQVRERFRDRLDIDPEAAPYLDGEPVDNDTVIRAGQLLMFARRAGEKGHGNRHDRG